MPNSPFKTVELTREQQVLASGILHRFQSSFRSVLGCYEALSHGPHNVRGRQ